jgi:hypothetical protein
MMKKFAQIIIVLIIFVCYVYVTNELNKEGLRNYSETDKGHLPSENMYDFMTKTDDDFVDEEVYIDINNLDLSPPYSKENLRANLVDNDDLIRDFYYFNNFSTIQSGSKYISE